MNKGHEMHSFTLDREETNLDSSWVTIHWEIAPCPQREKNKVNAEGFWTSYFNDSTLILADNIPQWRSYIQNDNSIESEELFV